MLSYTAGRSASSSRVLCPLLPATLMNLVPQSSHFCTSGKCQPLAYQLLGLCWPIRSWADTWGCPSVNFNPGCQQLQHRNVTGTFPRTSPGQSLCVLQFDSTPRMNEKGRPGNEGRAAVQCVWACGLHSSDSILVTWEWLLAALPLSSDSGAGQNWKKKTSSRTCWVQLAG